MNLLFVSPSHLNCVVSNHSHPSHFTFASHIHSLLPCKTSNAINTNDCSLPSNYHHWLKNVGDTRYMAYRKSLQQGIWVHGWSGELTISGDNHVITCIYTIHYNNKPYLVTTNLLAGWDPDIATQN